MTAKYRGYKIDVKRAKALGGWSQLYYSVFRRDGLECTSGFCDCAETELEFANHLVGRIDSELELPRKERWR